jgi:hypothetical protein
MDTGYSATATGNAGASIAATETKDDDGYLTLGKLKKQYLDYLSVKRAEIDEQKESRRYRHGSHYTQTQMEVFKLRKQPAVIYNEISRKINGTVGTIERERHDPKAFPRTPQHEEGAELATAVIRYVMDEQDWKAKSPIVGADGATEGIGGIEIIIGKGDQGDAEVEFDVVEPDGFFYDARSVRLDFSDARYMGVGKWMDIDQAKEMFPDKANDLDALQDGSDLSSNSDKDQKWFSSENGRIRVVDHWYLHKGGWCYCIYTGSMKLMEGKSYLVDEKKKTFCKYIMFSAYVDQDGDRYGMVRQFKSAQDEVNARGSKGLHELNTRRIIAEYGAFDDIEATRREAARPDGMVIRNKGFEAEFDDSAKMANIEGQLKFLERAQNRIDSYGPNLSLVGGETEKALSGRATQMLMQAGMAELGPFLISYRGWKLRVYRALFNALKGHWTAERYIRVTDDEGLAQFIQINGTQVDPQTGQPAMVNALGALDVDIILDEGPDSITIAQETYDTLGNVLSSVGPMLSPAEARAAVQILIDTSAMPSASKKMFKEASKQASQPDPVQQQAQQIELATGAAKAKETEASAGLKEAQTIKTMMEAHAGPEQTSMQPQPYEPPPPLQDAKMMAEIDATTAKAEQSRAAADKARQDAMMMPMEHAMDAHNAHADRMMNMHNAEEDRAIAAKQAQQRAKAPA